MSKKYIEARLRKGEKKVEFIATDETLDRASEVIPIDSWDLKNYSKNPVLLVNHDYKVQNIVGRAEDLHFENINGRMAMVFTPSFHKITQLSKEVEMMVKEEVLSTVSVGFLQKQPTADGDKQTNELMEISFVPVPANPSAERIKSLLDPQLSPEEEVAVKAFAEPEVKEGKILSKKNRELLDNTIKALEDALIPLKDLKKVAEDSDNEEKGARETVETLDTTKKGGKGRAEAFEHQMLKHLAREINGALYKANRKK